MIKYISLFKKIAPDIIEYRGGGGCLSLFGLPFLVAGLYIMQIPTGFIPVEGDSPPWYFLVPFGFVFAAAGFAMVFGRNGTTIDLRKRKILQWWGLLVPFKRNTHSLDLFNTVRLSKESGDSDSSDTYPIYLEGSNTGNRLKINASTDYQTAKYSAEELSRFLNFTMDDDTSTVIITRKPGELNESLRQRMRKNGQVSNSLPRKPTEMLSKIQQTSEGYVIEIPWTNQKKSGMLHLIINIIVAGFIIYFFLLPILTLPMPDIIRYIFIGFILLVFILVPIISTLLKLRKKKTCHTRITLTSVCLKIEDCSRRRKSITEIPIEELEELVLPTDKQTLKRPNHSGKEKDIHIGETGMPRMVNGRKVPKLVYKLMKSVPHPGITVCSRNQQLTIGEGLLMEELVYLHAFIRKIIAD
jgi:hypothetical protein